MIPWIQVYSNIITHPKTYALAEKLNLSSASISGNTMAAGMLVGLWSWATQNASNGDLTDCPKQVIADAAGWKKKPETLIEALISARWLDRSDGLYIHDWEEYASLLMEQLDNQKEKTKQRVKRYRDNKAAKTSQGSNVNVTLHSNECNASCNDTETLCNASTVPNLTVPNQSSNIVSGNNNSGGSTVQGGVTVAADAFGMVMGTYQDKINPMASGDVIESLKRYLAVMDADVIIKAINAACDEKNRKWSYINGILRSWQDKGVHNLADWQEIQDEHDRAKGKNSGQGFTYDDSYKGRSL